MSPPGQHAAPAAPSSHFGEVITRGLFSLMAHFGLTLTEKAKPQDLLLTDPTIGGGEGEHSAGGRITLHPRSQTKGIWRAGSKNPL